MIGDEILLGSAVVERLGWTLVHFIWQGAVVAGLLALALRAIDVRASGTRYGVSLLAFAALLVLPAATWMVLGDAAPAVGSPLAQETAVAANPPQAVLPDVGTEGETFATTALLPAPASRTTPMSWVVLAWLCGVVFFAARFVIEVGRARRLGRSGTVLLGERQQRLVARLAERLKVRRPFLALASHRIDVPTVVGWVRPRLLVPVRAITGLTQDQLEAVIAHELAHIRRFDDVVNLLQCIVETVFFYHPAVWWVSRTVRVERESCCDDVAARLLDSRFVVAQALTRVEVLRQAPMLAVAANGGSLLERVRRLALAPAPRTKLRAGPIGALVAMVLLLGAAGLQVDMWSDAAACDPPPDRLTIKRLQEQKGDPLVVPMEGITLPLVEPLTLPADELRVDARDPLILPLDRLRVDVADPLIAPRVRLRVDAADPLILKLDELRVDVADPLVVPVDRLGVTELEGVTIPLDRLRVDPQRSDDECPDPTKPIETRKVPILGDLPLLNNLFRDTRPAEDLLDEGRRDPRTDETRAPDEKSERDIRTLQEVLRRLRELSDDTNPNTGTLGQLLRDDETMPNLEILESIRRLQRRDPRATRTDETVAPKRELRLGDEFTIHRGGKLVGRARVAEILPEGVRLEFLDPSTKPKDEMKPERVRLENQRGKVVKVLRDLGFAWVDLGRHKGSRRGDRLAVVRGSRFIGELVIVSVDAGLSKTRIVSEVEGQSVEDGDPVLRLKGRRTLDEIAPEPRKDPRTEKRRTDAQVLAVRMPENLVILSAGTDEGVAVGDEFTIARGVTFLGRVKVIRVTDDMTAARIEHGADGRTIEVGDKAISIEKRERAAKVKPVRGPALDTRVVAVRPDANLAILSAGTKDGVKDGDEFRIVRGAAFIARVRVLRVTDDMAGAKIIHGADGSTIEVGDVATREKVRVF